MERHPARGQRLKDISYVNFWATCDTYMEVGYMTVDELLHKLKNPFARCWNPRDVGTFIKGVKYEVDGTLIREGEHLFQAPRQNVVIRLSRTTIVIGMKT
jgi:hypothetical protein